MREAAPVPSGTFATAKASASDWASRALRVKAGGSTGSVRRWPLVYRRLAAWRVKRVLELQSPDSSGCLRLAAAAGFAVDGLDCNLVRLAGRRARAECVGSRSALAMRRDRGRRGLRGGRRSDRSCGWRWGRLAELALGGVLPVELV